MAYTEPPSPIPHDRVDPLFRLDREILEADLKGMSPNAVICEVLKLLYDVAPMYTKAKIQRLFNPD